tara:strand:- start:3627 stop:4754 length:1128 start_codon:yes stop_codon:yes gene_type:complete
MKLYLSAHSLIYPINGETFLIYQLLTRKGILVDFSFFKQYPQIEDKSDNNPYVSFKDVSMFSLSECLLDNSNGIFKNLSDQKLERKKLNFFVEDAKKYSILVVRAEDYKNRLGKKTNLFDQFHTGNFHQNIGEYVLKNHKENAEWWWITQKFQENFLETTDTPYKWVQEEFMNDFFTNNKLKGRKVLDFGCGIGYYSAFFSKLGADVVGVDPSDQYLEIAKSVHSNNSKVKYKKAKFEVPEDFNFLDKDFDAIFLSDVFLYFFEPYKKLELTPEIVLSKLKSLINKSGKIYIMDPHGIFHLQPWIDTKLPFVLSLEYANRKYRVTPNLEEVSLVVEKSGMVISKIRELKYNGDDPNKSYYSEFPFWWFFELSRID